MNSRRVPPALVFAVYLAAWLSVDLLGVRLEHAYGALPRGWDAAVSLTLVWAFGPRWMPAIVAAHLLGWVAFGAGNAAITLVDVLVTATVAALGYGAAAALLRGPLRVSVPLRGPRDAFVLCAVAGAIGPFVIGLGWTAWWGMRGIVPWTEFGAHLRGSWIRDAAGICVMMPLLGAFAARALGARETLRPLTGPREIALLLTLLVACVAAAFGLGRGGDPNDYLSVTVPVLLWLAIRGGLPAAFIGNAVLDVAAFAFALLARIDGATFAQSQFVVITQALTAITIGGLQSQRVRESLKRRAAESEVLRVLFTDALTGLPNRAHCEDWMRQQGALTDVAVLAIDVDQMDIVNAGIGRHGGDAVLRATAERIDACVPDRLLLAHLGSDAFLVVVNAPRGSAAARAILAAVEAPIVVDGMEVFATVSIGMTRARDPRAGDDLVREAIVAQRFAKDAGRARVVSFSDGMEDDRERLPLVSQLRHALDRDEFVLYYQPIVQLTDGAVIGSEALLRWRHPERGLLEPGAFLGALATTTLWDRVCAWVLDDACARARAQRDAGIPGAIWINAGSRDLARPAYANEVLDAIARHGIAPDAIVLEVNEAVVAGERMLIEPLLALRAGGVTLAIDDFGTGHSSLGRLRELPIDVLKLDRSFVHGVETDERARGIATTILRLADDLGVATLAEGIETQAQYDFFVERGCRYGQGFLIARPAPPQAPERQPAR